MENGLQTDICILDFSKAFDKVGHRRLLEKLKWYGIGEGGGGINAWIKSFLTARIQTVVLDGISSDFASVISGVPQGSVLGPILFLLYINDIVKDIHGTVRLFADDTMIYMIIRSENDAARFQQDLDLLSEWGKTWMMEFHQDKQAGGNKFRHAHHFGRSEQFIPTKLEFIPTKHPYHLLYQKSNKFFFFFSFF